MIIQGIIKVSIESFDKLKFFVVIELILCVSGDIAGFEMYESKILVFYSKFIVIHVKIYFCCNYIKFIMGGVMNGITTILYYFISRIQMRKLVVSTST